MLQPGQPGSKIQVTNLNWTFLQGAECTHEIPQCVHRRAKAPYSSIGDLCRQPADSLEDAQCNKFARDQK